jgi:uncharacterized membrane protein YeaQ/YmgE (transglycosylase-associated protein family)
MYLILLLVCGVTVGVMARWIGPEEDRGGWVVSSVLGILGAVFGSLLGRAFGLYGPGHPAGFLMPVLGAVLSAGVYRALALRRPLRAPNRWWRPTTRR